MVRFATEMRSPESRPGHRPGRTFEEELNLRYLSPGAFTVLGPEDRGLPPEPSQPPPVYRLSPNSRRHRNQAFSIIAEPLSGRSRSPSPTSGRVSPFRGRGFNPTGSRHTSPAPSPPPGERINQYPINIVNRPTNVSRKSQIPQLKRREIASILFTEDSEESPKYKRKNATNLKPQLSKSLNNIGPKNNPYKPPTNPTTRRQPGISSKTGGHGFSRLSPIIGSSPEPSSDNKSQSSPISRIPKSRSTPPSRKTSPNRDASSEYQNSSQEDTPDYNGNKDDRKSHSRDHSPSYVKGNHSPSHEKSGRKHDRRGRYSPEVLDHRGKPRQREPEFIDYKGKIRSRENSPEYQSESTSRGKTSSSREGSPDYHKSSRGKISSREGSPEYHRRGKVSSREGSPDYHRRREHSPTKGNHSSSRPHSPSRGKHVSTREHSPEHHRNGKGRDHSPSRRKHSSSREHSPEHSPSRKYSSSREQSPEHHRKRAGTSREHSPEYHSRGKHHSSSGKHHKSESPDYHRRKKPAESRESSPEYKDSKTHISTSRHQSPGNIKSPNNRSRVNSRAGSRNASRNPSRDVSPSSSKPPFSPTRIPIRNYKNVQSKVNSYAKIQTTSTKSKVPSKPQESKSRTGLSRTDSVSKNVSKPQTGKFGGSGSNLSKASGSNTNLNKTGGVKSSSSQNNLNRASVRTPGTTTINNNSNNKKTNTSVKGVSKGRDGNGNIDDGDEVNGNSKINSSSKTSTKTINNNQKDQKGGKINVKPVVTNKAKTNEPLKKVESSAKLDLPPTTNTVVSSTTSTVTQPLKIEAKLDGGDAEKPKMKETPMYMDEDSQTLLKDHNMSKLSPAASAIVTLSNENNSVNAALPNVETVTTTNRIDTASQNVNNSVSNISNNVNNSNPMGVENNVKNNINKLISPDDSFGAKVNSYENSANDRIKEARTMVASDVKPIRITVQEKPNDVEVQSGNVRFPPNITNGVASGPGGAPPQAENGNGQPEPPKSRCQMFMERCRNKMPCSCCKPKEKKVEDAAAKEEKEARGCFSCCKKKKKVEVEQVIVSSPEDVENAKKTFMERLKCCKSNKVGDSTTGCCGRGKRKESWQDRRDSILSAPIPISKGAKCKNFLKMIFCCGCACACCKSKGQPPKMLEGTSASRRASMLSKKKSLTPTVLPPEEPKNKLDTSLVEYTSTMKAAIPVLPIALAYICLFFNIFAPGTGTVFSGLFCLCMGIPRFSQRDGPKPRLGAFIINIIIGCGQLFTVLFCLVGWGWSIWWGVIMVKIAKKYKKLKKIEERLQAQEKAAADAAAEEKRKDAEKGRT